MVLFVIGVDERLYSRIFSPFLIARPPWRHKRQFVIIIIPSCNAVQSQYLQRFSTALLY